MYICPEILSPYSTQLDDSGGETRKEADKTLVQDSSMYSNYMYVYVRVRTVYDSAVRTRTITCIVDNKKQSTQHNTTRQRHAA